MKDKLRSRIDELKNHRFHEIAKLSEWAILEDTSKTEKFPPKNWESADKIRVNDYWSGLDRYFWVQKELEIPNEKNVYLVLDFGNSDSIGYDYGFEALMFIDGEPYSGVDQYHQEVRIAEKYIGKKITVTLRLWTGMAGGEGVELFHQFKNGQLTLLDQKTDELYYLTDQLHKTTEELDDANPLKYQLTQILNKTFKFISWSEHESDQFLESIYEAHSYLHAEIEAIPKHPAYKVMTVGHTHIDVAWLWQLKHTREKAARSFSTVLRLMEDYPDYTFMQTTPQLYKYIKEDYPEMYAKIKALVAEGRWEADGAMWVEPDTNIPSGESLTRQILHGKNFFNEEFDKDPEYLWLPDVFGYSGALPQILKKSDLSTFMTTKISWNQYNRMPHDTFYWRGIDGSEILTHCITTPEPGEEQYIDTGWYYTYNGELEPDTILGAYEAYQDKEINSDMLINFGYGDGGGGVTREMLEKRRSLDKIPGLPSVTPGYANEYFDALHKTVNETDEYVHTWDGELYLELHRGTYTAQAYTKYANRKGEILVYNIETLYSLLEMNDIVEYPTEQMNEMWEILLRNQFHDIIPGSSITEVYEDHREEFKRFLEIAEELMAPWLSPENKETPADELTIFNTLGWERTSLVKLPEKYRQVEFVTDDGEVAEAVVDSEGNNWLKIADIPALSTKKLQVRAKLSEPERKSEHPFILSKNTVDTPFYELEWSETGQLTRLYDKKLRRNILKGQGNVLHLFEDKPKKPEHDAWDIDIFYTEKEKILKAHKVEVVAENHLFVALKFSYVFGNSTLSQVMKVYAHTPRIDFETKVDWQERQQLLKASFEVDVRSTKATYDIQYGNLERPTNWNTSWDFARFETVGHQWVDLSQNDFGVSVLNDSKYGYDIKDNVIRLSLLTGSIRPDPEADIGKHQFTYSLLPHKGNFLEGNTVIEAWDLNNPLNYLETDKLQIPKISIQADYRVDIDAIKKAENGNGWILRLHDYSGGNQTVNIKIEGITWWNETNLVERDLEEAKTTKIELSLTPYEIKTVRVGK